MSKHANDKVKELIAKIKEIDEQLKDHVGFHHVFSEDNAKATLAKLRRNIGEMNFLATIAGLKETRHTEGKPIQENRRSGSFVKISPCSKKYEGKTYLGLLIGNAALSSSISIDDDKISCEWSFYNPAIFVFDLGKVIYGCESYWGVIKSENDLKEITDADIENVWYVKALKQLSNKED